MQAHEHDFCFFNQVKDLFVSTFWDNLKEQRWDDHRYYHHSTINQTLHLISAISFVVAYILVWTDPAIAALLAWLVSMVSRQSGHFFFEPKGYDEVNQATHEHKEEIKVGYNLHRKVVLMGIWALIPVWLWINPSVLGLFEPHTDLVGFARAVGWAWFALGVGGLLFRVLQLAVQQDLKTGVVWATKILTDPFHDIALYHRSPLLVLRGQWLAPARQH